MRSGSSSLDEIIMTRAIALAKQGMGHVSPNPMVGAVLVKSGKIIAEGWHQKFGGPHAEIVALQKAGQRARGSTLYISLEPCLHWGKTPPCTDAIIKARLSRVVAAMSDPNRLMRGKSFIRLRHAGIKVDVGVLESMSRRLNQPFIKVHTKGVPYITIKAAMSLDGKNATAKGDSRWVSGEASRQLVQRWRSTTDAILVGVNTVLRDDPRLTPRLVKVSRHPLRVILDSEGRTPPGAEVIRTPPRTVIMVTSRAPASRLQRLTRRGAEIWRMPEGPGGVDVRAAMKRLAKEGVLHLLVEAGGTVAASLFESDLVDHMSMFIAPKLVGGRQAPTPIEGRGVARMALAKSLMNVKMQKIGEDILVEGDVHRDY